jgi:hypothetical protein
VGSTTIKQEQVNDQEDVQMSAIDAELRIEESKGPDHKITRLQGVLIGTAPRAGEIVELDEGRFKVIEVSHKFSNSPSKHFVVVTVEKPQPTMFQ